MKVALQEVKEESESGGVYRRHSRARGRRGVIATLVAGLLLIAAGAAWLLRPHPNVESPPMRVVPLTTLPGGEFGPTFSPDGEQVAFEWDGEKHDNGDIYVTIVGSSEIHRLTTNPAADYAPSWSPDGRQIAFCALLPDLSPHRFTSCQRSVGQTSV